MSYYNPTFDEIENTCNKNEHKSLPQVIRGCLGKMNKEYKENLNTIDDLRAKMVQTDSYKELSLIMELINEYNDRNSELLILIREQEKRKEA